MKPFEKIIEKNGITTIGNNEVNIVHNTKDTPYCVISFNSWKNYCLQTKNKLQIINKK